MIAVPREQRRQPRNLDLRMRCRDDGADAEEVGVGVMALVGRDGGDVGAGVGAVEGFWVGEG